MRISVVLVSLAALSLAGCKSLDPDAGLVSFATASNGQALDGAQCAVSTRSQAWRIVTPATVDVGPGNGDLRVVCTKQGYRTSELILPPYQQATGSSVGFGMAGGSGNVGMGLGFGYPLTTNGWYPDNIVVNMQPLQEQ